VQAEFTAALAVTVALGIWLTIEASGLGTLILGIWLIGRSQLRTAGGERCTGGQPLSLLFMSLQRVVFLPSARTT
jgi:hypothetical protein